MIKIYSELNELLEQIAEIKTKYSLIPYEGSIEIKEKQKQIHL